jgi:hypothetical protein
MSDVWRHSPTSLTPSQLLVLLVIADAANDTSRMMWESIATIQTKANLSESTVHEALRVLKSLNIVTVPPEEEWPVTSHRYSSVVRRINSPSDWVGAKGCEIRTPEEGTETKSNNRGVRLGAPNSDTNNHIDPYRRDYVSPITDGAKRRRKKIKPPAEEDSNPLRDTWDSLADPTIDQPSAHPVADQIVEDADDDTIRRTSIRKRSRGRKESGPDTGTGLARYFREQLTLTGKGGATGLIPGTFDTEMGRRLVEWKQAGITPDQIRAMIDIYVSNEGMRTRAAVPWKDFLAKRMALAVELDNRQGKRTAEDHRYDDAYWVR